jgi:hypothetical protein
MSTPSGLVCPRWKNSISQTGPPLRQQWCAAPLVCACEGRPELGKGLRRALGSRSSARPTFPPSIIQSHSLSFLADGRGIVPMRGGFEDHLEEACGRSSCVRCSAAFTVARLDCYQWLRKPICAAPQLHFARRLPHLREKMEPNQGFYWPELVALTALL